MQFSLLCATTTAKAAAKSVTNRSSGLTIQSQSFTSPHHTGKSYCLQTLSPLKTTVLANTLFCTLMQLNTLYSDLNMGISNNWIHLDQFNVMLLEKLQAERTAEDELVFQKNPLVNY